MKALLVEIVVASIARSARRFMTQALLVFAVTIACCGALWINTSGRTEIERRVSESGSLEYRVRGVDPATGGPAAFDTQTIDVLATADQVESVQVSIPLEVEVTDADGLQAREPVGVVATNLAALNDDRPIVLAGTPPFPANAFGVDDQVVVGVGAARSLGITTACVLAQTCPLHVAGRTMRVSTVARFADAAADQSVFVTIDRAVSDEMTRGPSDITVVARGLPADTVARHLDELASLSSLTVFVDAPEASASLRAGISDTWGATTAAVAIVLVALGAVAQFAFQTVSVRFRRSEIATLRSLGCTPGFVTAQFVLEPFLAGLVGVIGAVVVAASTQRALDHAGWVGNLPGASTAVIVVSVLVTCVATSTIAARRAVRRAPLDALGSP